METTSSPKRTICEVSDSDFEDSADKKSKVECQICTEPVETSELVECQTIKQSSSNVSHSVCVKCFSKMNKCPFCRTAYDPQANGEAEEEEKVPDYVPPSPVLYQEEEDEEKDEAVARYAEFMHKVKAVGNSIRLMALYPRVRDTVRGGAFRWPETLSLSSLYNFQFFKWVIDQEVRVHGNPSILHQVVDSNLRLEALQLILDGEYKGLLQLQASARSRHSMIARIFSTWCERSPDILAQVVRWYHDTDLAKHLDPTQMVKAGLQDVPWAVQSKTVQDLGLALGRINVVQVLAGLRKVPPLDTVKGLGELDPQATWDALESWIEGKEGDNRFGLDKSYLEMLKAIRPRGESVSLWTQGQYDAVGFQRNALIRQVMPEAVKTTFVNLAEEGKVGLAPRGMGTANVWEPVVPHLKPASNDFFFVDRKHPHVLVTEAKLPGVAPNEKFVIVYYHNEHPRQYRVYVSIKAQGNTGLDRYIDDHCLPLSGTDNGRPFDGLWVPNAQFIVALKNRPRN